MSSASITRCCDTISWSHLDGNVGSISTGLKLHLWLTVHSKFTLTVAILKIVEGIPQIQTTNSLHRFTITDLPKTASLFLEQAVALLAADNLYSKLCV